MYLVFYFKKFKIKKLGNLSINPENVIKNEELVNLKGGYLGGGSVYCNCYIVWSDGAATSVSGYCGTSSSCRECGEDLERYYGALQADCE